jgi:hypothetical protein
MRKGWRMGAAIGALVVSWTVTAAAASLNGTTWMTDDCDFEIFELSAHGTGEVVDAEDDDEYADAKWTLQGKHIHLDIPAWAETFDGTLDDDEHLSGTATTRDKKKGDRQLSCHFTKFG